MELTIIPGNRTYRIVDRYGKTVKKFRSRLEAEGFVKGKIVQSAPVASSSEKQPPVASSKRKRDESGYEDLRESPRRFSDEKKRDFWIEFSKLPEFRLRKILVNMIHGLEFLGLYDIKSTEGIESCIRNWVFDLAGPRNKSEEKLFEWLEK